MGETFVVESLEEMCDMMCDNVVPKEKERWYYFTFGSGQVHAGFYVRIWGTYGSARSKMVDKYGDKWSFQYSEEQWKKWEQKRPKYFPIERELEVIE